MLQSHFFNYCAAATDTRASTLLPHTHTVPVCISGPGRVGVTALLIAPRGDLLGGWCSLASHTANPQRHADVSQPVTKRECLDVRNTCLACVPNTPLFQVHINDISHIAESTFLHDK